MKVEIHISDLKKIVEWAELNEKYGSAPYVILEENVGQIEVKQPNWDQDCCANTMHVKKHQQVI